MISLLVSLAKFLFLAVFTFFFVVLFEHGPGNFAQGVPAEWNSLVGFVTVHADGAASAPVPAASPSTTP